MNRSTAKKQTKYGYCLLGWSFCSWHILAALLLIAIPVRGLPAAESSTFPEPGIRQDRAIPADKSVSWFVATNGNDTNDGKTRATAFATMQKAVDTAVPGETVLVLKGIYREGFWVHGKTGDDAHWLNIVAEPGVEINGADPAREWTASPEHPGVYSMPRPELYPGWWQTEKVSLQERPEQVFHGSLSVMQVKEMAQLNPQKRSAFYVNDAEKRLYLCLTGAKNPANEPVFVTQRTWAIQIGIKPNKNSWDDFTLDQNSRACHVRVAGFQIRYIGDFSRQGGIQISGSCSDIIVEDCDVQWVNYCGIRIGGLSRFDRQAEEWRHMWPERIVIRHNVVSNNGVQGIGGECHKNTLVEANVIDGNNYKAMSVWNEGGAVKFLACSGCNICWNVARNNDNHGLWYDYADGGNIIENNLVFNSMAGGILNEVTPQPVVVYGADGNTSFKIRTAEECRSEAIAGTTIRNNIIIGTRSPGGGGINNSNSFRARISNNIVYDVTGPAITLGGSAGRPGAGRNFGNEAWTNICSDNFQNGYLSSDIESRDGRFFANYQFSNLYSGAKNVHPFSIGGTSAGAEEWEKANAGKKNFYTQKSIFKDAENWDFTITNSVETQRIGFQPEQMRLNWNKYKVARAAEPSGRRVDFSGLQLAPLDLSSVRNRSLRDQTAGDGQGGWSDQGENDLRNLPAGEQVFNGVKFNIPDGEKQACLLKSEMVKGNFPEQVTIPVGKIYSELFFLFAGVWVQPEEIVRLRIAYDDGTAQEQPVRSGKEILDWWCDPTWQQQETLNSNGAYVAWQGANGKVAKVTAYYLRVPCAQPDKIITSITLAKSAQTPQTAFFLLAVSAAEQKDTAPGRIVYAGFEGDADVVTSTGKVLTPLNQKTQMFDLGTFETGHKGNALRPSSGLHYELPKEFPHGVQGTIALRVKLDDWRGQQLQELFRKIDYTCNQTAFEITSAQDTKWTPWYINFHVTGKKLDHLQLEAVASGTAISADVTNTVHSGNWSEVIFTWRPDADGKTVYELYLNGKLCGKTTGKTPDAVNWKNGFRLGCAANGGYLFRGVLDEFSVCNRYLPPQNSGQP